MAVSKQDMDEANTITVVCGSYKTLNLNSTGIC